MLASAVPYIALSSRPDEVKSWQGERNTTTDFASSMRLPVRPDGFLRTTGVVVHLSGEGVSGGSAGVGRLA